MKIHCFKTISRITACFVILAFTTSLIISPQMANAQSVPNLPQSGAMLTPSHSFIPPYLIGITVNPENPFRFNFIVDTGNSNIEGEELRSESNKLIRYFLATMTIPEEDLWVNLSPYERDRIIPDEFGKTEMGRDLLAQDYILKQFTASLMYPEDEIGNDFWDRVYKKANELYGTTEMPVNTFNKVWIVPDRAVVHEHNHSVMVVDTHLRVMLEEDYLATSKNLDNKEMGTDQLVKQDVEALSNAYLSVIRDVLIPEIEKEVNEGEHFAPLRQIYHSMVLATWYKKKLRNSPLNAVYADQKKVAGVDVDDKEVNQKIYDQYIEAFRKGVYDYIKEDYDEASQQIIPRKYFSGGLDLTGQEFVQGQTQQRRKAGGLYNLETDLRFTSDAGEGGAMGRWKYESTSFDPQAGQLTLHNAIRIPRRDGAVEEEFLIQGENKPRDIVLQTREFSEEEKRRLAETKMELGIRAVPFRIIARDNSAMNNRIYGFAAHGHGFLREDILTQGTKGQIKEALDHEARELSDALHVNIREEQFQGGLRELITILSTKDKDEGLSYFKKRSRVWSALDNETPVIEESSEYGARLYFLGHGLHMYISMSTGGHQSIYVSNMGKNHVIRGYTYEGENPGGEILIDETDKELLRSQVRQLLSRLRSDRGIDELLRVVEKNEAETARMDALKAKYARDVVTDEEERAKILEELNPLFDIDLEELTSGQVDRIQQLVAALGNDPIYTAEKKHPDDWPTNHGMDRSIYNIKQGDVLYIQYGVMSRDNEEEVFAEVEGQIQEVPRFGGKSVLTMADGTEINLNQVREIIVDNGRGGHYKVDKDAGGMDPYFFLMGGHLQREVIQGDLPDGVEVQQAGEYAYVQWPGVDKYLPVKFITAKKVTKEDAFRTLLRLDSNK